MDGVGTAAADASREHRTHDAPGPGFKAQGGSLYVVATPLGNLRDVTLRALDLLGSVDLVVAEDTRVTAVLLRHYGIDARLSPLHEHNEARRTAGLIAALGSGQSIALVSDAGTPAISDPGSRLVRAAAAAGHNVVPVPGASALVTAISAAGLAAQAFVFLGFLEREGKARRATLAHYASLPAAVVLYEAPHRVAATVAVLADVFDARRDLIVARELTKAFETIARMPLAEAGAWFAADANRERGEFVLIVDAPLPADEARPRQLDADAEAWLRALLAELPPARAARVVAARLSLPRDVVYARAIALKA
jgi:16S rRNA (cytidine1402-2'-O)-methyltransferase